MNRRSSALGITVVWADPDLQEVAVSASSQSFAGEVNLYAGPDELAGLADRIRGFPSGPRDRRECRLGQANLAGYGTAHLTFFCSDSTGHVIAEAVLRRNPGEVELGAESSVVHITAVPADIDRFEAELRNVGNQVGASAVLKNAA